MDLEASCLHTCILLKHRGTYTHTSWADKHDEKYLTVELVSFCDIKWVLPVKYIPNVF